MFCELLGHNSQIKDPDLEYPILHPRHLFPVYPSAQVPVKS